MAMVSYDRTRFASWGDQGYYDITGEVLVSGDVQYDEPDMDPNEWFPLSDVVVHRVAFQIVQSGPLSVADYNGVSSLPFTGISRSRNVVSSVSDSFDVIRDVRDTLSAHGCQNVTVTWNPSPAIVSKQVTGSVDGDFQ